MVVNKSVRKQDLFVRFGSLALSMSLGAVIAAGAVMMPQSVSTARADQPIHKQEIAMPTLRPAIPAQKDHWMVALPDLSVALNQLPPPIQRDPMATNMTIDRYRAVISNVGTAAVPQPTRDTPDFVAVNFQVPGQGSEVSATGKGWSCNEMGATGQSDLVKFMTCFSKEQLPLQPGASLSPIFLNVHPKSNAPMALPVSATALTLYERNVENNTAVVPVANTPGNGMDGFVAARAQDLSIATTHDGGMHFEVGQSITYHVNMTNSRMRPYFGVAPVLLDFLPPGLTDIQVQPHDKGIQCHVSANHPITGLTTVWCSGIAKISPQAGSIVDISGTFTDAVLHSGFPGIYVNTAILHSAELTQSNNISADLVGVKPAVLLNSDKQLKNDKQPNSNKQP